MASLATSEDSSYMMLSLPTQWTSGRYPSVSVKPHGDVKVVVCVYDVTVGNNIYYCVGVINKDMGVTDWGTIGEVCGSGWRPRAALVSMSEKLYIIETHCFDSSKFCSRVGEVKLDSKTITWGISDSSKDGVNPSISATCTDDGTAMVGTAMVVTEDRRSNRIQLYSGTLNTEHRKVEWKEITDIPNFRGMEPDICIGANIIVVVCRCGSYRSIIRFKTGQIERDLHISWASASELPRSDSGNYRDGRNPSISFNSSGAIVEVHQTWTLRKLSWSCGLVKRGSITWGESKIHDFGEYPSISLCDDGFFYEIHKTHFGTHLFTEQGQLITQTVSLT